MEMTETGTVCLALCGMRELRAEVVVRQLPYHVLHHTSPDLCPVARPLRGIFLPCRSQRDGSRETNLLICALGVRSGPTSRGRVMNLVNQVACKRCGSGMKTVVEIAPFGNHPGLIAFVCDDCGVTESRLLYPLGIDRRVVHERQP